MKKILLAIAAAAPALGAVAEVETKTYYDVIVGFSTDGRYASSEMYGTVIVYDLDTDDHFDYFETNTNTYGVGNGNFWGRDGMVGFIDNAGGSSVWKAGRWSRLPLAASDPAGMGSANAITPDMSRICGNASTGAGLVLDGADLMVYPCYWDANANGTYGRQQPLPYPTEDLIGQAPQYVTAVSITEDGRTIWGQITSGNGFYHEPIVYHQNPETNEWTYDLPLRSQCLPEGIEVVPYPGDGPVIPSMENFMTEEELEAYDEAYNRYREDPSLKEPTYAEFMTPEEIAAYNEALKPYLEWSEEYKVYENMLRELSEKGITFVFNLMRISPNGRYVAMATEKAYYSASGQSTAFYTPYVYDTVTGQGKSIGLEGYSMLPSAVSNEGNVLGSLDAGGADLGYVYMAETEQWMPYTDYLRSRDASLAKWIEDNMVHEVEVEIDPESGLTDFMEMEISGRPFVSADWNTFSSYAYNFWGGADKGKYISYIVRFTDESGIESVTDDSSAAGSDSVKFFDLQGREVLNPSNGIFIKRSGNETVKIAL